MTAAAKKIFASSKARFALGIALGSFFLLLSVRGVNWTEARAALQNADFRFVVLAFVLTLANIFTKILRWKILLSAPTNSTEFQDVSAAFLSAQLFNSLFPMRVGEVSRVALMGSRGADHGSIVVTILIEKYLDLIAFGILIGAVVLMFPLPGWLESPARGLMALILLSTLVVLFMRLNRAFILHWVERASARFSDRIATFMRMNLQSVYSAFYAIGRTPHLSAAGASTLLIWVTAIGTNQVLFYTFDLVLPIEAGLLTLAAIQAGLALPALPGRIGVFEYACILALGMFGVDQSIALSYGILLHAIVYLPIIISGLLSIQYWQMSVPDSVRNKTNQIE